MKTEEQRQGIDKPRLIYAALISLIFGMLGLFFSRFLDQCHDFTSRIFISVFFGCLLFGVLFWLLHLEPALSVTAFSLLALCAVALLFVRFFMLNNISMDYVQFLSQWLAKMREYNGVEALRQPIGDYNMPYMYFLFLISKMKLPDLYMIKLLSITFDCILGYYVCKLVSLYTTKTHIRFAAFFATLLVPTVIFNGAYWGQCDVIYTTFALGGLYYGLTRRPRLCVIFFALALSVKIQTIFLLPILLVFWFVKKVNWKNLLWFPATFVAVLLPAITARKPVLDTISIYYKQVSQYPALTLSAPSLYAFIPNEQRYFDMLNSPGILLAGLVTLAFLTQLFYFRSKLNTLRLIQAAFLFTLLLPFFLPKMHERYFYMADVLSVVYIFYYPKRWFVAPLVVGASLVGYARYLFSNTFIPLFVAALGVWIAILFVYIMFLTDLRHANSEKAL